MKFRISVTGLFILLSCLSLYFPTFAQQQKKQEKSFQGKWVLEDVYIHNQKDTNPISADSLKIEFFQKIEFNQNSFLFLFDGTIQINEYHQLGRHLVYLNWMNDSFYAEWALLNNKLYLEWAKDIPLQGGEIETYTILLTYKRP